VLLELSDTVLELLDCAPLSSLATFLVEFAEIVKVVDLQKKTVSAQSHRRQFLS
jgi:hypothetical protein